MATVVVVPAFGSFSEDLSLVDEKLLKAEKDHESGVLGVVTPYFAILKESGFGTTKTEAEAFLRKWEDWCLTDFGLHSMWDESTKRALLVKRLVDSGKSKAKAESEVAALEVHVRSRGYIENIGRSILRIHLYADMAAAVDVPLKFTLGLFTKTEWVPKWDKDGKLLPCKALAGVVEAPAAKAAGPQTAKIPTKKKAEEAMDKALEGFILLGGDYAKAAAEVHLSLVKYKIRVESAE